MHVNMIVASLFNRFTISFILVFQGNKFPLVFYPSTKDTQKGG